MNDLLTRLRSPVLSHEDAHHAMLEAANELERLLRIANLIPLHPAPKTWQQRQQFITAHLASHHKINSTFLMLAFGISKPQAHLDLARWQRNNPNTLTYDATRKVFVLSPPVMETPNDTR